MSKFYSLKSYFRNIFTIKAIAEAGILTAVAVILQIFSNVAFGRIFSFAFAEGWSPWLDIIPVAILFIRRGTFLAAISALIAELLAFTIGNGSVIMLLAPGAFALDFLVAKFASVLVGGFAMFMLTKYFKKSRWWAFNISIIIISIVGFLGGFASGVVFYGEYAEWQGAWVYSFVYNFLAWAIAYIFLILTINIFHKNHKDLVSPQIHGHNY